MIIISREYFKRLVAENELDNLVEELFQFLTNFISTRKDVDIADVYDTLILVSGKYKSIKHEKLLGLIESKDFRDEVNKIHSSLLSLINSIPATVFEFHLGIITKTESAREKIKKINKSSRFIYDIFLSFSQKNIREAKKISEELRGYGLRVFLSDEMLKLNVGVSFFEKIELALNSSKNFLLLTTPHAMKSEWVKTEYETFYNEFYVNNKNERRFIIFKGIDFEKAVIPSLLKRLQFANNVSEVLQSFIEDDIDRKRMGRNRSQQENPAIEIKEKKGRRGRKDSDNKDIKKGSNDEQRVLASEETEQKSSSVQENQADEVIDKKSREKQEVTAGDIIKVHYHGKLTDGETFDSSAGREPLEFEVGSGVVIPGFDEAVTGMSVGEKKTINIPFAEAYGPKKEEMIIEMPKDRFPADLELGVGLSLMMSDQQGQQFQVSIREIKDDVVVLDANHPLAGQDLIFDLELVEIVGEKPLIILP